MEKKNYLKPEIQADEISLKDVLGISNTPFSDTFIDDNDIVG